MFIGIDLKKYCLLTKCCFLSTVRLLLPASPRQNFVKPKLVFICFNSKRTNFIVLFSIFHWLKKKFWNLLFCSISWFVNFVWVTLVTLVAL